MRHNGIVLGPNSVLRARAALEATRLLESEVQMLVLEALIGKARPGQPRQLGDGLTGKYPDLMLVYAINPNKGGRKKAAAGIARAMGLLADLPDLHLPVARGPFYSLYVEIKRDQYERSRPSQRFMQDQLRAAGHAVVEAHGVEEGVAPFLAYLTLPTMFEDTPAIVESRRRHEAMISPRRKE